jgi:hypothetical protein
MKRKHVHRQIRHLMKTDGDCCSLCRADFQHRNRTPGGVTRDGEIALVGDCCAKKIARPCISGVWGSA